MAKCNHCSAPLPKDSIICEYCGVRNDIEVQEVPLASVQPKSNRMCPDCMIYLDSIDIGKNSIFIIEKCERCFGLFFDNFELKRLLEESNVKSYWIDYKRLQSLLQYPLHKDKIQYRKCPQCNKIMQRKNYMNRSGVIMDTCVDHGIWLDAGELKQIKDWIKLGGKRNALKDELDHKHIKARDKNRKRKSYNRQSDIYYSKEIVSETSYFTDIVDLVSTTYRLASRFRF